jgi:hypothetical protein
MGFKCLCSDRTAVEPHKHQSTCTDDGVQETAWRRRRRGSDGPVDERERVFVAGIVVVEGSEVDGVIGMGSGSGIQKFTLRSASRMMKSTVSGGVSKYK